MDAMRRFFFDFPPPRFAYNDGMKAIWNGEVIAESDDTVVVEGNHYFPKDSVDPEVLVESSTHTICPWKGTASYYTLRQSGEESPDAAWYYPTPKPGAEMVTDRVAFWKDVVVSE
jgi:uncharacterized protein (DUF427 family)